MRQADTALYEAKRSGRATLVPTANLVDAVWSDRPAPPVSLVEFLGHNRAGQSAEDKLAELQKFFPEGVSFSVPYDTSTFISVSIEKVVHTLIEAMVLVFVVMFATVAQLWFRAWMSGASIGPVHLVVMKLKRINPEVIVDCRINAVQAAAEKLGYSNMPAVSGAGAGSQGGCGADAITGLATTSGTSPGTSASCWAMGPRRATRASDHP